MGDLPDSALPSSDQTYIRHQGEYPMEGPEMSNRRSTMTPSFGSSEHTHICEWLEDGHVKRHTYTHRNGECHGFLIRPCHHEVYFPTISSRLAQLAHDRTYVPSEQTFKRIQRRTVTNEPS